MVDQGLDVQSPGRGIAAVLAAMALTSCYTDAAEPIFQTHCRAWWQDETGPFFMNRLEAILDTALLVRYATCSRESGVKITVSTS